MDTVEIEPKKDSFECEKDLFDSFIEKERDLIIILGFTNLKKLLWMLSFL